MNQICIDEIFKCDVCEKSYKLISSLNKHKKKAHCSEKDVSTTINTAEIYYDNIECGTILNTIFKKTKKKKAIKESQIEILFSKLMKNEKQQSVWDTHSDHYETRENDITSIHNMDKVFNNKINKCDLCDKSYELKSSLNKHKKKVHSLENDVSTTVNTTDICNDYTECEPLFKTVKKKKKKKSTMEAQIAKLSSSDIKKKEQQIHGATKNDISTVIKKKSFIGKINKCDVCEKSYKLISSLNKHKKKAHCSEKDVSTTINTAEIYYDNIECGTILNTIFKKTKKKKAIKESQIEILFSKLMKNEKQQSVWDTHSDHYETRENDITSIHNMDKVFNNKINKCDLCDKSYELKSSLNKHKKKVHSLENDVSTTVNTTDICNDYTECEPLFKTVKKKKKKKSTMEAQIAKLSSSDIKKKEQQIHGATKNDISTVIKKKSFIGKINKCDVCEKSYKLISSLNKHKKKAHCSEKDVSTTINTTDICNDYTECEPLFKTVKKKKKKKSTMEAQIAKLPSSDMKKKEQIHGATKNDISKVIKKKSFIGKINKCDVCTRSYGLISSLYKHKKKAHRSEDVSSRINTVEISEKTLECTLKVQKNKLKTAKKPKKNKAIEETQIDMLSSKEKKNNQQSVMGYTDHSEQLENDIATEIMYNNGNDKIYKCDYCKKSYKCISSLNKHKRKAHSVQKDVFNTKNDTKTTNVDQNSLLLEKKCKKLKKKNQKSNKLLTMTNTISTNDMYTMSKTDYSTLNKDVSKLPSTDFLDFNKNKNRSHNTSGGKSCNEQLENDTTIENIDKTCKNKINKCDICEKSYECISSLNKHKDKVHNAMKEVSTIIKNMEMWEDNIESLKTVKKSKNRKTIEEIEKLSPTFMNKKNWQTLGDTDPDEQLENDFANKPMDTICNDKTYKCNLCKKSFNILLSLNKHKKSTHHIENDESAIICNMFNTLEEDEEYTLLLKKHMKQLKKKKKISNKVESQDITLPFNETALHTTYYEPCNQQLLRNDHGCDVCTKSFTCKSKLDQHKRIHTGEKPYACMVCGATFSQKSTLISHYRIHTGEKPYACKVCGAAFTLRSTLIKHNRIHTGEKPYACKVCGATFSATSTLISHNRIHTGEKPYACKVCGATFRQTTTLNCHYRIHTGKKPYACKVCGKTFTHQSTLIRHNRIHTGEKPFKCALCHMSFRYSSHRLRHMRSKHNRSF